MAGIQKTQKEFLQSICSALNFCWCCVQADSEYTRLTFEIGCNLCYVLTTFDLTFMSMDPNTSNTSLIPFTDDLLGCLVKAVLKKPTV